MKRNQLCGIGNSLIDILVNIPEDVFQKLGLERATMRLVDAEKQFSLLKSIDLTSVNRVSGGSVANSVIAFSQLGGTGSFLGSVADDDNGKSYRKEFEKLGIDFPVIAHKGGKTGTSVIVVTPDAERTMSTSLAVSSLLSASHMHEGVIADSEWLFVEGYLFSNPENGQQAVATALEFAKKHKTKVAVTCSESWVVTTFRDALDTALAQAALVFANEDEARSLANLGVDATGEEAFEILIQKYPGLVITLGARGALTWIDGKKGKAESVKMTPVDLTGAGDMFAGSFLYGIVNGLAPEVAAKKACYLASRVISHVGARFRGNLKEEWKLA